MSLEFEDLGKTQEIIPLAEGMMLGQFKLLKLIGTGGMGSVYRAFDEKLERDVALKFISRRVSFSVSDQPQLMKEAKVISALNHPNILTIHDIQKSGGHEFIVMEHIDGTSLKSIIKSGPLACDQAVHIVAQCARGLAAAHEKRIVHRDIKSENIMMDRQGHVKIMDFGLALHMLPETDLTQVRVFAGTPLYMSPEQVQGLPLDQRSDIFSLGVVLYELLTGQLPFKGDYQLAVLYSIIHSEPIPPSNLNPGIPDTIESIVLKCLQKPREDRFQSCDEILDALQSATTVNAAAPIESINRAIQHSITPIKSPTLALIGRDGELKVFDKILVTVMSGKGHTIFVRGEAGIGKSQLASYVVDRARNARASVFWGRAIHNEGGLPYHPFSSALKQGFLNFDEEVIENLSRRATGTGISLPVRVEVLRSFLGKPGAGESLANREQLWDAILGFFRVMAIDRPVLLVLDDLHWSDEESLALLSYLARNIANTPLLILGMSRSDPSSDEANLVRETCRQLRIEGVADEIELKRFDREQTSSLIDLALGSSVVESQVVDLIYEQSSGNPLFALELIKLLRDRKSLNETDGVWRIRDRAALDAVPQRVHDVISQRLLRLSEKQREILEFACCQGERFESSAISECLNIDRVSLLRQLQSIQNDHALIRFEKDSYAIDHPLIRETIYQGTMEELRREYHSLLAKWMRSKYESDEFAGRIARQYHLAGKMGESLPFFVRAGNRALSVFALKEAASNFSDAWTIVESESSVEETLRLSTIEGLGDVASISGETQVARKHYEILMSEMRRLKLNHELPRALRKFAAEARLSNDTDRALKVSREAVELARDQGNQFELVACLNTYGFIQFSQFANWQEAQSAYIEAIDIAKSLGDRRAQANGMSNLALAYVHRGDLRDATDWLLQAQQVQQEIGDILGLSKTLNFLGISQHRLGKFEDSIHCFKESITYKRKLGESRAIPGGLNGLADVYREIGDLDQAIKLHEESLQLAREHQNKASECDNLRDLGKDHMMIGNLELSRKYLDEVYNLSRQIGNAWYETRSYISLSELNCIEENKRDALDFADKALTLSRKLESRELLIEAVIAASTAFSQEDTRMTSVVDLLNEAIALAEEKGYDIYLWRLHQLLGDHLKSLGDLDESLAEREKAEQIINRIVSGINDEKLREQFLLLTKALNIQKKAN